MIGSCSKDLGIVEVMFVMSGDLFPGRSLPQGCEDDTSRRGNNSSGMSVNVFHSSGIIDNEL